MARNVRVRSLMGWLAVDRLMAGDLVIDASGNCREVRGLRQVKVSGDALVRIARKGRAPLVLGEGQSLCAEDWRTQVLFGQAAICTAARLVDGATVRRGQPHGAVLYQLEFDTAVCLDIDGATAVFTPGR